MGLKESNFYRREISNKVLEDLMTLYFQKKKKEKGNHKVRDLKKTLTDSGKC